MQPSSHTPYFGALFILSSVSQWVREARRSAGHRCQHDAGTGCRSPTIACASVCGLDLSGISRRTVVGKWGPPAGSVNRINVQKPSGPPDLTVSLPARLFSAFLCCSCVASECGFINGCRLVLSPFTAGPSLAVPCTSPALLPSAEEFDGGPDPAFVGLNPGSARSCQVPSSKSASICPRPCL